MLDNIGSYSPIINRRRNQRQYKRNLTDSGNEAVEWATELDGTAIRLASVHAYVDKATICFKAPGHDVVSWLRRVVKLHEWRSPNQWERCFTLMQPSREVFEYLARHGVRLTSIELALDWTFDSEYERDRAYRIFCTYSYKKHCRGETIYCKSTRYSGRRRSRSNLVSYPDKPSKDSGEVYCVHVEMRLKGSAALERNSIGIDKDFDHREFWRRHLRMAKVEAQRLGRLYDNQVRGQNRRKPDIKQSSSGFVYDGDSRAGNMFIRAYKATQEVINKLREKGVDIQHRQCVKSIAVEHLLPEGEGEEDAEGGRMLSAERQYIS